MKKHPDRKPCRAVAVNGCYDDDANRDQDFERKRIDGPLEATLFCGGGFDGVTGIDPGAGAA